VCGRDEFVPERAVHRAVDLQPLMAYTLDINMDPAPAQTGSVAVPLYRTRFTTSKYASLNELATDLVRAACACAPERALNLNVTFPAPSPYPPNSPVNYQQVTDQVIESAFVAAGEQALPLLLKTRSPCIGFPDRAMGLRSLLHPDGLHGTVVAHTTGAFAGSG